jgi:CubicO group peptidase (beta-lactamase class C family)
MTGSGCARCWPHSSQHGNRGTAHGESALFYGHPAVELARRVDGRGVGCFLREEVCGPAGLDFAVRLSPAQQPRAVEVTGLDESFRAGNAADRPAPYRQAVANPTGAQDGAVVTAPPGGPRRSPPSTATEPRPQWPASTTP